RYSLSDVRFITQTKRKGNVTEWDFGFSSGRFILPHEFPAFIWFTGNFMSKKSSAIAGLIGQFQGRELDAHYLGYFECFNRQLYFEAHDVLEELWLAQRSGSNYAFYKGLIQLAGAFVHLKKNRLRLAAALFKLADANLGKYPPLHEHLDLGYVRQLIRQWVGNLEAANFEQNPLTPHNVPALALEPS